MLAGCCKDERKQEISSEKYIAVHVIGNCGATEPYDNYIRVAEREPRLGLDFLGAQSEIVFDIESTEPTVEAVWKTPTSLIIRCKKCSAGIVKQLSTWKDVQISYEIN